MQLRPSTPRRRTLAAVVIGGVGAASGFIGASASAATAPISFWGGSAIPAHAAASDSGSVELGLGFRSDVAGQVTGVRFYKGAGNTGTHVGSLWDASGKRLSSATFSNETASGWQSATFSAPVTIAAASTYVISYHANAGHYAYDDGYFTSKTVSNGSLHTLGSPNGVYSYASTPTFPSRPYLNTNYWVDVNFAPGVPSIPTATPTPTPTPTTRAPVGTWPGPTNTGVPAGHALTASGPITVGTAGAVVDGKDVAGCITVNAPNVTIQNSRVRGSCTNVIQNNSTGLVVKDTEIDGQNGVANGEAIGWNNYTALRVNIHNTGDGLRANGSVLVQDSWIHDLWECSLCHNDGIQLTEGSGVVIRHNTIQNSHSQTSNVLIKGDQGAISNVSVDGNNLNGGGYTVYALNAAYPVSGIAFTNNTFGKLYFPKCGYWGFSDLNTTVQWSGNVWSDTGQAVAGP